MLGFLIRASIVALGLWLATIWVNGVSIDTPATYNVRTAAALLRAGQLLGEKEWCDAALKNFDWALTQQADNGWFENNCLTDADRSLTHTIGYTLEGLLDAAADRPPSTLRRHLAAPGR